MGEFSLTYAVALQTDLDLRGSVRQLLQRLEDAGPPRALLRGGVRMLYTISDGLLYTESRTFEPIDCHRTAHETEQHLTFVFQEQGQSVILSRKLFPTISTKQGISMSARFAQALATVSKLEASPEQELKSLFRKSGTQFSVYDEGSQIVAEQTGSGIFEVESSWMLKLGRLVDKHDFDVEIQGLRSGFIAFIFTPKF